MKCRPITLVLASLLALVLSSVMALPAIAGAADTRDQVKDQAVGGAATDLMRVRTFYPGVRVRVVITVRDLKKRTMTRTRLMSAEGTDVVSDLFVRIQDGRATASVRETGNFGSRIRCKSVPVRYQWAQDRIAVRIPNRKCLGFLMGAIKVRTTSYSATGGWGTPADESPWQRVSKG